MDIIDPDATHTDDDLRRVENRAVVVGYVLGLISGAAVALALVVALHKFGG